MTKTEFLTKLETELKHKNVSDISDILSEYEQHFVFKSAEGYSEEEISAKLGTPKSIADQYDTEIPGYNKSKKIITAIGLGITDFFFGILCIFLYAWEIVVGLLVIAFGTLSVGLLANLKNSEYIFIPKLPYHCAFILGLSFIALTVISVIGTIYFFKFIQQLICSFKRFHKNTLASASGRATLPSIPIYPQFSLKNKHIFKKILTFAVIAFAVCFITGFIVCVISAGAFEFWHVWGWFSNLR